MINSKIVFPFDKLGAGNVLYRVLRNFSEGGLARNRFVDKS